ncbi:MAG: peptidase M48 [Porphyromonadaceae bacterium CG2_30_38_12]|nr:MAG: peptidase M48 [Porphyromonadaceae bacterium CG2_30_38_12]
MKKAVLFAIVGLFLASCSSVLLTGRKQLLLVSDTEVLAMSATSYKQFVDSVPASKNTVQTAIVKRVGNNIAKAVENYLRANNLADEIANLKWEFNLVKDTNVNAFCMPGGKVVFFEGIMPIAKTEAGVATVMGHEVAHAIAKHSNERLSQQMVTSYGANLASILVSNKSAATQQTIGILYGLGTQVGVILPYSRKHEYEADRLGMIFMAMAGYDPNEAISFWERMSANGKSSTMEIMSTHPSDVNRVAQLKANINEALPFYKK